ncbi:hypothetical protein MSPP1_001110 [Malassezia sp. CBS 17886]|nr:hypothetical protein MSPP1_001110 [Malassezia sp. CBS 17886]
MSQNRGSYLSAQPGFLNAPSARPNGAPTSWLGRLWAQEIANPAKIWGNVALAWNIGFFALSVLFVRRAGFMITPTF